MAYKILLVSFYLARMWPIVSATSGHRCGENIMVVVYRVPYLVLLFLSLLCQVVRPPREAD